MTLEKLIEQRENLERHIFSGHRRVEFDGSIVEYFSVAEMQAALSQLNGRIADLQAPQRSRIFTIKTSRGI